MSEEDYSDRTILRQDIEAICSELLELLPEYIYQHRLPDVIARQIAGRVNDTEDDLVTAIDRRELNPDAWMLHDIWTHLAKGATPEVLRFFTLCRSAWE